VSNVTSTAPAAFDFFLNAIKDAGALANVTVRDSQLAQYEPGSYIELTAIANNRFDIESMPWFAFIETYELQGVVRVFRGDTDMQQARVDAFAIYQSYVMTPVVNNTRLGDLVMYIIPASANAVSETTSSGGRQCVIDFAFAVTARVTV
jgi:hypothetical protein